MQQTWCMASMTGLGFITTCLTLLLSTRSIMLLMICGACFSSSVLLVVEGASAGTVSAGGASASSSVHSKEGNHGLWQQLTEQNFTDLHNHHFALCFAMLSWCGEGRSLMRQVSRSMMEDPEAFAALQLRFVYIDKDRALLNLLPPTARRSSSLRIYLYHQGTPYFHGGQLTAGHILRAIRHVMHVPDGDLPVQHLQSFDVVKSFMESTDRAFLLLDFCGWAHSIRQKPWQEEEEEKDKEEDSMEGKMGPTNNRVVGLLQQGVADDASVNLKQKQCFETSTAVDAEECNNVEDEKKTDGAESDQLVEDVVTDVLHVPSRNMAGFFGSGTWEEDVYTVASNLQGTVLDDAQERRSKPHVEEEEQQQQQQQRRGHSEISDSQCEKQVEKEHFTAVYRNFTKVASNHALIPHRARFGWLTNESVAVEAGLVEEVGAVVSWQLLAQVQDPYSSPEYFGDGDGDVEAFILGVSPSHVVELEGAGLPQHGPALWSFLHDMPSLLLFIDRSSHLPYVQALSHTALQVIRDVACHYATKVEHRRKVKGIPQAHGASKSVRQEEMTTDEFLEASIPAGLEQRMRVQMLETADLLKLLGRSSSGAVELQTGNGKVVFQLKGDVKGLGATSKLPVANPALSVQELLASSKEQIGAPSVTDVIRSLLNSQVDTATPSSQSLGSTDTHENSAPSADRDGDEDVSSTSIQMPEGEQDTTGSESDREDSEEPSILKQSHAEETRPPLGGDQCLVEDAGRNSCEGGLASECPGVNRNNISLEVAPTLESSQQGRVDPEMAEIDKVQEHSCQTEQESDESLQKVAAEHQNLDEDETNMRFKPAISFFFRDGDDLLQERLTMTTKVPTVVILNPASEAHYVFPVEEPLTQLSLIEFIDQFLMGQLKETVRSEPPPRPLREGPRPPFVNRDFRKVDPVPRVTADTFCHQVLGCMTGGSFEGQNSLFQKAGGVKVNESGLIGPAWSKDVVVLFTTPWCGFCKRMELIVQELHRSLKFYVGSSTTQEHQHQSKTLEDPEKGTQSAANNVEDDDTHDLPQLLQMDCSLNDCDKLFTIHFHLDASYPTVALYPAQNKHAPIIFEGAAEVCSLHQFISRYGRASAKLRSKFSGAHGSKRSVADCYRPESPLFENSHLSARGVQADNLNKASTLVSQTAAKTQISSPEQQLQQNSEIANPGKIGGGGDLSQPRVGSILVASLPLSRVSHVFKQAVILLVHVDKGLGIQGLILNKPLPTESLQNLDGALQNLLKSLPLGYGGPVSVPGVSYFILTKVAGLPNFQEVLPGIFYGAAGSSISLVHWMASAKLTTHDVWIFVGCASWSWSQLEEEISSNFWSLQSYRGGIVRWPSHWTNPQFL